jgi:hypothetical protein
MVFLNIDPTPMLLPGFSRVIVQGMVPYILMVTPQAVPRNEDLSIIMSGTFIVVPFSPQMIMSLS